MSKTIDLIGLAGIALVGWGLSMWHVYFLVIFTGVVLLWVARTLAAEEKTDEKGK